MISHRTADYDEYIRHGEEDYWSASASYTYDPQTNELNIVSTSGPLVSSGRPSSAYCGDPEAAMKLFAQNAAVVLRRNDGMHGKIVETIFSMGEKTLVDKPEYSYAFILEKPDRIKKYEIKQWGHVQKLDRNNIL